MKYVRSFVVTVKTKEKVSMAFLIDRIVTGFSNANACGDPEDMLDDYDLTVNSIPGRKG